MSLPESFHVTFICTSYATLLSSGVQMIGTMIFQSFNHERIIVVDYWSASVLFLASVFSGIHLVFLLYCEKKKT